MTNAIFNPLYEDEDILVIEKKKAFLSQKSDQGSQEGLFEFISRIKGVDLYPVHRLDREVLGIMVFAKTPSSAEALSRAFRDRSVQKVYWAWVYGRASENETQLIHYLRKNPKTNVTTVFPEPSPGAKRAELVYKKLSSQKDLSLVEVHLKTGRSHQIRAQLAKVGHAIVGDHRYGRRIPSHRTQGFEGLSIQLRARALGFKHPRTQEWCSWEISLSKQDFFY